MAGRIGTRFGLMLALVLVALGAWAVGQGSTITAAQSNFVGGAPSQPDASDIRALRLRFEPGVRSNWHSHGGFPGDHGRAGARSAKATSAAAYGAGSGRAARGVTARIAQLSRNRRCASRTTG